MKMMFAELPLFKVFDIFLLTSANRTLTRKRVEFADDGFFLTASTIWPCGAHRSILMPGTFPCKSITYSPSQEDRIIAEKQLVEIL
jgi:hypothetical protein